MREKGKMIATKESTELNLRHPINFNSAIFNENKYQVYKWLRENEPVYKGRVSVISGYFLSHYEDCVAMLKDPRFVRNRENLVGESKFSFYSVSDRF